MKNDLTAEEWLTLAYYVKKIQPEMLANASPMFNEKTKQEARIAERAKEKFLATADKIRSGK